MLFAIRGLFISVWTVKPCRKIHDEDYRFVPGAVVTVMGSELALVATGSTVHEVVDAAELLAQSGIAATVVSVPSIRPVTPKHCWQLKGCKAVMTVEEHNVNGGLGSLVAEVLAEAGTGITLNAQALWMEEYAAAADRGWLRQHHGFDAAGIAAQAREMLLNYLPDNPHAAVCGCLSARHKVNNIITPY